jgi:nucleosome binding factor SPN SPT16 subunit
MTRGKNDILHSHHINQVPKKGFEFIKEWLESVNCLVFESPLSISWEIAVAEIRSSKRRM